MPQTILSLLQFLITYQIIYQKFILPFNGVRLLIESLMSRH